MKTFTNLTDAKQNDACKAIAVQLVAEGDTITSSRIMNTAKMILLKAVYCDDGFSFNGGTTKSFKAFFMDWIVKDGDEYNAILEVLKGEKQA